MGECRHISTYLSPSHWMEASGSFTTRLIYHAPQIRQRFKVLENLQLKIYVIMNETSLIWDTGCKYVTTAEIFIAFTKPKMLQYFQFYEHNDDRLITTTETSNCGSAIRLIVSPGRRISKRTCIIHRIIALHILCASRRLGSLR